MIQDHGASPKNINNELFTLRLRISFEINFRYVPACNEELAHWKKSEIYEK